MKYNLLNLPSEVRAHQYFESDMNQDFSDFRDSTAAGTLPGTGSGSGIGSVMLNDRPEHLLSGSDTTSMASPDEHLSGTAMLRPVGELLSRTVYYADGTRAEVYCPADSSTVKYIGSMIYESTPSGESISGILTANGYIDCRGGTDNSEMQYFLRDHLGSVRVVVADRNTVISRRDYLPSGVQMTGNGLTTDYSNGSSWYGFSGKESERDGSRYLHFGARTYDPVGCIFLQTDKLAENYYSFSPYSYCLGNPVIYIDPDGNKPRVYIETSGVGHAFLTTGENDNLTIYTFGRTGHIPEFFIKTGTEAFAPCGEGVLSILKGKDAKNYLLERTNSNIHYTIFEFDGDDSKIDEYYQSLFENGSKPTDGISYGKEYARVISKYVVFYNNCVTTTAEGLCHGGVDIISERGTLLLSPAELISEILKGNLYVEYYIGEAAKEFVKNIINEKSE